MAGGCVLEKNKLQAFLKNLLILAIIKNSINLKILNYM